MQKSLHIDPGKCTGCLQCESACSLENEGMFNPAKSRIKVFSFHDEGRYVPYTCTQCDEAWCMQACPVDAIVLNPVNGSKDVKEDTKTLRKISVWVARSAQLPARSAPLITTPQPAKWSSVTCAAVIHSVPLIVPPGLSPTLILTLPAWIKCVPGLQKLTTRLHRRS